MSPLIPGLTGGIYREKNKYVAVFRFCDILIFFGTLSMSFRMCGLGLIHRCIIINLVSMKGEKFGFSQFNPSNKKSM